MRKALSLLAIATLAVAVSGAADASMLKLGTASGGLMIYYNNTDVSGASGTPDGVISGYDENPGNQAYVQTQYDYDVTNGMYFQFDDTDLGGVSFNDIFSGQPVGSSQFGFDLLSHALTYDPAGGVTLPTFSFWDNVDNTVAGADETPAPLSLGDGAWSITDYKGPTGAAAGSPINSIFRGTAFTLNILDLRVVGSTYEIDVEGWLQSDGLFHWYNPAFGTSTLGSWQFQDALYMEGTLVYETNYSLRDWGTEGNTYGPGIGTLENGSDQRDFYEGQLNVYVVPVPEPATMTLLGLGLGGLALRRVRRKRS